MASEQAHIPMDATPTAEQRLAALAMLPRRFGRRDPAGADAVLAFVLSGRSNAERERRSQALSLAFADEGAGGLDEALVEAGRLAAYAEGQHTASTAPAASAGRGPAE